MKCFDVVLKVLDETYAQIPGSEAQRDATITSAIGAMSSQYTNNLMTSGGPNFNDAATRFGYVYQYVPAHAHWVYDLISKSPHARSILDGGKARISCIGGGPGSDLVGVLKLLDEQGIDCKLFCELIDGCEQWKSTWSDLAYTLELDNALHTDYVIHNIADKSTWDSPSQIDKADIITLSYFVSEIFHLAASTEYLTGMLLRAKQGAMLFVVDNRTQVVWERTDNIAKSAGFTLIEKGDELLKIWDSGEQTSTLQKYESKFKRKSKLTGQAFWRIFRKT